MGVQGSCPHLLVAVIQGAGPICDQFVPAVGTMCAQECCPQKMTPKPKNISKSRPAPACLGESLHVWAHGHMLS